MYQHNQGVVCWHRQFLQWLMLAEPQCHLAPLIVSCRKIVNSIIVLQLLTECFYAYSVKSSYGVLRGDKLLCGPILNFMVLVRG